MPNLDTKVAEIRGIGEKKAGFLAKLGLFTLRDVLRFFPRDYEDRREIKRLCDVLPGESACVEGGLINTPTLSRIRRGLDITKCRISDGTAVCDVTFFNQSWIKNRLNMDENYVFYGKFGDGDLLRRELTNPAFEPEGTNRTTGRILPVYRLTAGIGRAAMTSVVEAALAAADGDFPEPIPAPIRKRFDLLDAETAYLNIHFPADDKLLEQARRRFVFEELFILSLGLRGERLERANDAPVISPLDPSEFIDKLPFPLTGAQRRSIDEIFADLCSGRPMNRLLQGDVGSGKTVVAAAAAWLCCKSGHQTALMAPTELLAAQHFRSLEPMMRSLGLRVGLLIGSLPAAEKRAVQAAIAMGDYDLVIGTHALITDAVEFRSLGLVITDEQHRFGVRQRAALAEKGRSAHVLVMSATPIPRTLSLIIYGDLDLSVIDELPPGRQPIKTYSVGESYRERLRAFIRKLVGEGRQVYIVCPLVESAEGLDDGRKAVEKYAEELDTKIFPDLTVEFVHGKMKAKQKDEIMRRFAAGEVDILVATTVIEVGIDVPNAALMVVENAENFGLSQLHQLRGRVGRGAYESYCVLVRGGGGDATRERLAVMCSTQNGFKIAEADLKLRGPGDFFGSRQHGLPALRVADLEADAETMKSAADAADELLADDPKLKKQANSAAKQAVERMFADSTLN